MSAPQAPVADRETQEKTRRRAVIQICAWCLPGEIRVLSAPRAVGEAPIITFELDERRHPRSAHAIANSEVIDVAISRGICGDCRKKLYRQKSKVAPVPEWPNRDL